MELSKQKNYQQSFDFACSSIQGMNLEERAKKAGANYEKGKGREKITVHFLLEPYHIQFPQIEFHSPSKKVVSLVTRILLLHYLIRADGNPLTGKWVAYKDITGGFLYAGVFARRVTEPLQRRFGKSAQSFKETGIRSGGEPVEIGDASFILQAFPYVPLQYVLWEGDEEFPPSVQLLFDASVDHYLTLEDMVVLGQVTTGRLINRSALSSDGSSCPPLCSPLAPACPAPGRDRDP
ncbi:MAG: hypothetical protein A2156_00035 [Deltaproteobacteria bacterium RBG_16_48_10]|nr:MAG: hypothetical protein A2156_00035 [Deltaproteobacteria bacterium RBG_16_48_10]